jgi:hypothetical protein
VPATIEDYSAGTHTDAYFQRDLHHALPVIMATFAHPPAPPSPWSYHTTERRFAVWGYRAQRQGGSPGRTVRVRGVAVACLSSGSPARVLNCHRQPLELRDPGLGGASDALPLRWGSQPSWLAFLRGVPVLGRLLPAAQAPHWGAGVTYRVQFRAVPADSCPSPPCYEALLLDGAPDTLGEG